jgi:hypothetical protein
MHLFFESVLKAESSLIAAMKDYIPVSFCCFGAFEIAESCFDIDFSYLLTKLLLNTFFVDCSADEN